MVGNEWKEIVGNPISADEAWRVLDEWKVRKKQIGLLFCGRSGTVVLSAMCRVGAVRNGVLRMKGEGAGASLNLKSATFTYGPMQVWPHWPAGPTVEVSALQAFLPTGDWVVLAEGYLPRELSPLALPI